MDQPTQRWVARALRAGENNIAALTTEEVAAGIPEGATPFTSDKELLRLATDWPAEGLVEIGNNRVKAIRVLQAPAVRSAQLAYQPSAGKLPITLQSRGGDAQCLGSFALTQACKIAQFHNP